MTSFIGYITNIIIKLLICIDKQFTNIIPY